MDFKLSESHFDLFTECSEIIIDFFNLNDWGINFAFSGEEEEARAWTYVTCRNNRVCSIFLNTSWDIPPTRENLFRCAFHECMELMLMDIQYVASSRTLLDGQLEREVHRVIRRLENTVFRSLMTNDESFDISDLPEIEECPEQEIPGVDNDEEMPITGV